MPTRTTRSNRRTQTTARPGRPRRATGTPSARRGTPSRRGIAGGWLQRRQPKPSGINRVLSTARRAIPGSKGSLAAAGLALVGAAGVAVRRRGNDHDAHDHTPASNVNPPVSGPPTQTVTTPPNTSAGITEPPAPPTAA